jgi:hypothetical protein
VNLNALATSYRDFAAGTLPCSGSHMLCQCCIGVSIQARGSAARRMQITAQLRPALAFAG